MPKKTAYVLANFGGPRDLDEIRPFLQELLLDPEVIRPTLPSFIHRMLFRRIAKKRSVKVKHDYEKIGGKSPIFEDTENLKRLLEERTSEEMITFHRYLPKTHPEFIAKMENLDADEIRILPLFPQFSYATTGSIANFFARKLSPETTVKIRWIKSYAGHPAFVGTYQKLIAEFLQENKLQEEETILLFSCHGIPEKFVEEGDIYQMECNISYRLVLKAFPYTLGRLSFQSRFGPEEWIKPYTEDVCQEIDSWSEGRKNIVIVPLSFTSDHIETLFEIEELYVKELLKKNYAAYRLPALNLRPDWVQGILTLFKETNLTNNQMLIRK